MKVEFEGTVINKGTSKKGNNYVQVLVPRVNGDGSDVVAVLVKNGAGYKINQKYRFTVNALVRVCSEI